VWATVFATVSAIMLATAVGQHDGTRPQKPSHVMLAKVDPKAGAKADQPPSSAAAPAELPGEAAFNSCTKLPAKRRVVRLNLKPDAGVMDLISWISSITCRQFLVAVPVAGKKVTIISPELITPDEAYRLFLAALDSLDLTVEWTGKFLRIIQSAKARFTPLPMIAPGEKMPANPRFVTRLVHLRYLNSVDFTNKVLNRLKEPTADIIAYRTSLIITDLSDNVKRMLKIIRQFDTPENPREKIWIVRVEHMSVFDMASRITEVANVLQLGTGQRKLAAHPAPPKHVPLPPGSLLSELTITKLIPDERTNSLIAVASDRAHEWLLALVHKFDEPLEEEGRGTEGRFHVYYCENANCNELAASLSAITGVQVVGSLTGPQRGKGAAARAPAPAAPGRQNPAALNFERDVRVTYDAATNSLVIMSTMRDYQSLLHVIQTLDSPRKQVFIEATIMEVLLDKTREIGVSYHAGTGTTVAGQNSLAMGGFNANQTMNPTSLISSLGGLSAAIFGPTTGDLGNSALFKGLPINIPSFGAFLQLLQTNNDVNILSRPDLLILNNQEGEISVGEVLPFPSMTSMSFAGATGASMSPFTSVQRQPVELKLKLSPSVNESDIVRLDVDQQISDVTSQNFNGMGPATSKRSIKTTVVVPDQQTVVIGGLMGDRIVETAQKIPILGDIPVLGFFFRSTTKQVKKSNILIALTPYVISDLSDLRRVAERKMRERREFVDRYSSIEDTHRVSAMDIDYHRRRGMLEEINRSVREMEKDEAILRKIRERDLQDESEPIKPAAQASAAGNGAETADGRRARGKPPAVKAGPMTSSANGVSPRGTP
jgi:general secretion pathway protein D